MGEPAETADVGDLLDDGDVEAAEKAVDAAEKPAEPAAAPEPKEEPSAEEFDRSSSFRDAMQDFEQYVPEDKRKAYRNRIEQGERWATGADEAKEVKGKLAEITTLAKTLAPIYEGGEEYLKREGPVKFLKQWNLEHGPHAPKPEPTKPPEEETEQDTLARLVSEQVQKAIAPLTQEQERLKTEREQDAAAKAFAADFDPRVLDVVGKWNLPEDVKAEVGTCFADFAQNLYQTAVYQNPDNPDAITVASAVAQAAKAIDAIVKARTSTRSTPPRPTVKTAQATDDVQQTAEEMLESLDVSDDIDEHWNSSK